MQVTSADRPPVIPQLFSLVQKTQTGLSRTQRDTEILSSGRVRCDYVTKTERAL